MSSRCKNKQKQAIRHKALKYNDKIITVGDLSSSHGDISKSSVWTARLVRILPRSGTDGERQDIHLNTETTKNQVTACIRS